MKTRDWWAAVHKSEYRSYFLVIIAAYASILLSLPFSLQRLALLVGLGIVYTLTGLFGLEYSQHVSSWPIRLTYFVEQIVIAALFSISARAQPSSSSLPSPRTVWCCCLVVELLPCAASCCCCLSS